MSFSNTDPTGNDSPIDRPNSQDIDSSASDLSNLESGLDIAIDIDIDSSDLETRHIEVSDLNQLHQLATQAIESGLILGHGYHQGQYEILRRNEVLLFSPDRAVAYLKTLLDTSLNSPADRQQGDHS